MINAKLYTFDENASTEEVVVCGLSAEGDTDEVINHTSSSNKAGYADSIGVDPLQVVHKFNSTGSATVSCYLNSGEAKNVFANHTKITAIQVSALTNTGV